MTRACLLGTASTWQKAPFADPSLRIVSLNDAYSMGVPRIDEHYELHPLDQMFFRPKAKKVFRPGELPEGQYIRPEGHLEWLKAQAQTIPVWLKEEPPADWPINAKRFPVEDITAKFGSYWASGPAYMIAHLYERGVRDLHIYGIHLATEAEYREQRPQFEMLLGRLLGPYATMRVEQGVRIWEGKEMVIRLPQEAPILCHGWQYAYERRPVKPGREAQAKYAQAQREYSTLSAKLVTWPRWKSKARELARLDELQAVMRDAQMQARHAQVSAGVGA